MKYIELLREGERVSDIYLCKNKTVAVTKNGKEYWSVLLQDKTGSIDGKVWEPGSIGIDDFEVLDYVEVNGDVTNFNGTLQLNIKRIRRAYEDEYDPADYLPVSPYETGAMYDELKACVGKVENEALHTLLSRIFLESGKVEEMFRQHSAAKSMHHSFVGGLLQHTLAVTRMCEFYCAQYPVLNRDLLLTAALLHDIGKMWEISPFPANDYTDDGQLLGHIVIGVEKIGSVIAKIPNFPQKLAAELKHCILAHHGELEYGSPKKPALAEALALHFADNTDAKLQMVTELLESPAAQSGEWLGYQKALESNFKKTWIG